ncbi:MAG: hypothetical protein E6G41_05990 [Actinobacteria bacterium]|nr:MAG: hypothetical protein E6G41_05990 [Actinomycetota bacterium]
MLLQAALNGPYTKDEHPAMPITAAELAADARACVEAGAGAIHMHPRNRHGEETLDPAVIDAAVQEVRAACGVPVGVSTGAWIEPDHALKLEYIRAWTEPDYASVNISEPGWQEVLRALRERGIGVEAGVWSVEDALALTESGLQGDVVRVLIEPVDADPTEAVALVAAIREQVQAPVLQHGDGAATWVLIEDAVTHGLDTRVGLEDTQEATNPALVARAMSLIRSGGQ